MELEIIYPQRLAWTPLDMGEGSVRRLSESLLGNYVLEDSIRRLARILLGHYILENFRENFQNLTQI